MRRIGSLVAATWGAAGLFLMGCGGGGTAQSCSEDKDCNQGYVCQNEKCAQRECKSPDDCDTQNHPDRVCALIPDLGAKYCTFRECSVQVPCSDPATECSADGICVPKTTQADAVVFDADAAPLDTPVGDAKDTGKDQGGEPPQGGDCKPCAQQTDCSQGYFCSALPGKTEPTYCLRECQNNADCDNGYICFQVTTQQKLCVPVTNKCHECAYKGCDQGQCCDLGTGECKPCAKECQNCIYDFQCQKGYRCFKSSGSISAGVCLAECGDSGQCPDPNKFQCADYGKEKEFKLCQPTDPNSCQGCPPQKPHLGPDGQCHECLNSAHCDTGQVCDTNTFTCTDKTCGTGARLCDDGQCHQCCTDADCQGVGTGKCVNYQCEGAQPLCQPECVPPYPACANINGVWQCVQCATDADCQGQCKCNNYVCVDPTTGAACGGGGSTCQATCQSDSDCPQDQTSGEQLKCNTKFGVCFKQNTCDGVAMCCAPGQECVDLLMLLFGGGIGGIPGLPGGTNTGLAFCTCSSPGDCLGGEPCTPLSLVCLVPFVGDLFCPGGQLPPTVPQNLCFDIGSILGGGGLPFP